MASKPEKGTKPSEDEIRAEISRQISDLMGKAKLSAKDRSKLRAVVGYMADGNDEEYDDFMLMYLSKDRDWREDYDTIFGDESKPAKMGKKFDITSVTGIKVID